MITLILSGRTTPERPRAEAMTHLKTVHGPIVYDAPSDAGAMPSVYVQNHVVDALPLPAALESWRWDRHLVTEISFEDIAHLKASTTSPYYLENLKPDEPRFVDPASVRPLIVNAAPANDHPDAVWPDAVWKVFVYLASTGDEQGFEKGWTEACALADPFCVTQSQRRPVKAPGAPPPFVDGVWCLWFESEADAHAFAVDHLEPALKLFGPHLDQARGQVVLAEQFDVTRLRSENTVRSMQAAL